MIRVTPRLSRVTLGSILAAVYCVPALAAPADFYLKLPDIDGESSGDRHKGEIEVLSWSWGATQSGGKMHLQDVSATGPTPAKGNVEYEWKVEEGESAPPPPGAAEITLKGSAAAAEAKRTPPTVTLKRGSAAAPEAAGGVRVASGDVDGDGSPTRASSPKLSEPIANGRVSMVVPAGTCRVGARYPSIELASAARTYRFEGVTVESCEAGTASAGDRPTESMSLNYTKVTG